MRENLIAALREKRQVFSGILGFEQTVIPDLERAILSRHHILLLGLRGQAKTRIARTLTALLDEWIPVLQGVELPEDPLQPITREAKELIEEKGELAPVGWLHRDERYVEKLATPDVSIADLIGDVDPIKAASMKLSYADERVIHYGLVPRAHRGLFVINELPDLQPRIQVALFNILQEGDIQIRGFHKRLQLDVAFLFTANPEDYTHRGSIITPLKDRIDAQILTHYPPDTATSQAITLQEVRMPDEQSARVTIGPLVLEVLDQIAFEARESAYIDPKSGVSARLNISAYELLASAVERRTLMHREDQGEARFTDLWGVIPAITGKVELVYEGEQEGMQAVAHHLMDMAFKTVFLRYFPHPDKKNSRDDKDPYGVVLTWFSAGNTLTMTPDMAESAHVRTLESVPGLRKLAAARMATPHHEGTGMELILHGLAAFHKISKIAEGPGIRFRDELAGALDDIDMNGDDGDP